MSSIKFDDLTTKDDDGNIIIDVNTLGEEVTDIRITDYYIVEYRKYNATNCYTCEDKKDPNIKWVLPTLCTYICSPYGWRIHPIYGDLRMHWGVDIDEVSYAPILSVRDGKVKEAGFEASGAGHYVVIDHEDGFVTKYLHMGPETKNSPSNRYKHIVKKGQKVSAGQIIGAVGTSGGSTGPHLHFSLLKNGSQVNPKEHIDFSTDNREDISRPNLRVQKELPTYDSFTPIQYSIDTIDDTNCTSNQLHIRRGSLIGDSKVSLFDMGKIDKRLGIGISCIGLKNKSSKVSGVLDKASILALYENKTGGFSLPTDADSANDGDCMKIAKYIYDKMTSTYGWSSEATFALLGNMHIESGLNPNRGEVGGSGYGLIQWTPKSTFENWYSKHRKQEWQGIHDIDAQLECINEIGTWSNSYSMSGYYMNHMDGYIRNISPNNPQQVIVNIYATSSTWDEVQCQPGYLWTNYYKGDTSDTERQKVYDDLKYYYNRGRVFDVTKEQFKKSKSSIGLLTVMYAINGEKPHKYALKPWRRIYASYVMSHYMGATDNFGIDISEDDEYLNSATNPYINESMNNNAYVWAKTMRILDTAGVSNKTNLVCDSSSKNWYKYNMDNDIFEYGMVPRKYAIACWEYLGNNRKCEKTRVAIVEDVLSTDYIKVSEYPHCKSGEYKSWNKIDDKNMTNPDYNWCQDKSAYKFLGFIYLLKNSETDSSTVDELQNGSISIVANSANKYSTILFGTTDIKHYNKVRVIYDVNVYSLHGNTTDLTCGVNISASHQVANCENADDDWRVTGFNKVANYENSTADFTHNYPFPMGSVQLHNENLKEYLGKGKISCDNTFKLNECRLGSKIVNPFSIDGYTSLNRELPFYISITPISFENDKASATVEVIIKKIILYR